MDNFFRSGLIIIAGVALLATAGAIHAILLEGFVWTASLAIVGFALCAWGGYSLRANLAAMVRKGRAEILLYTVGVIGIMAAIAYLSVQFPVRLDMTEEAKNSFSRQTAAMLKRLEKPVRLTSFPVTP